MDMQHRLPRESILAPLERLLPSVWVKICALLHLAAIITIIVDYRWWAYSLAAVLVSHVILMLGSLLPRSRVLGPNWTRLPAGEQRVALTIDDGPDPQVTPAVLDLLAAHRVRATFFCIGERAVQYPHLMQRIVREGHEVGNHTEHHRYVFSLFGPAAIRREIALAQASIEAVCQVVPRYFRAPAGLRNPFLQPCLTTLNLELASWTRRGYDTVNADAALILKRLTRNLAAGDILLLHDGRAARSREGTPMILAVLPQLLARLASQRLSCVTLYEGLTGP